MKARHCFLLVWVITGILNADTIKDIKFYNLEKEYRETKTYVYKVQQAEALELKQIISGMLTIYGSLYVNEETNELYITDVAEKIDDLETVIPGLDVQQIRAGNNLVSRRVYLKHENVSEISGIIKHKLSADGSVYEVPNLNALVITDIPSKINEVTDVLNLIDVPIDHIAIEITVVEFNDEEFSKLGINVFNWLQGLTLRTDLHGGRDILFKNRGSFMIGSKNEGNLSQRNHYLETEGDKAQPYHLSAELSVSDLVGFICENADGNVLAHTRIVTRNNKSASINAHEIIPFRFFENRSAFENRYESAVLAGMSVTVRPMVQQDSLINLRISPTISNLTGWSPKGMPIVFERRISTEVKVKDNKIFVLGGLKKREAIDVRKGIPGLKDIPVLQWLFSVRKKAVVEREVLIFIRPTTNVETAVDAKEFGEIMEKYKKKTEKKPRKRKEKKEEKEEKEKGE